MKKNLQEKRDSIISLGRVLDIFIIISPCHINWRSTSHIDRRRWLEKEEEFIIIEDNKSKWEKHFCLMEFGALAEEFVALNKIKKTQDESIMFVKRMSILISDKGNEREREKEKNNNGRSSTRRWIRNIIKDIYRSSTLAGMPKSFSFNRRVNSSTWICTKMKRWMIRSVIK